MSYFAQGGTPGGACVVTPTTGCLIFDNTVLPGEAGPVDTNGYTVTISASFSFNSTCNFLNASTICPTDSLNNFATGGGTYVIKNASGTVVEQGTLTTANTAGSLFEGLSSALYAASDGLTATTCSQAPAADRSVLVYSSTGLSTDPYVELGVGVPFSPVNNGTAAFATIGGYVFQGPLTGVTLSC